MGSSSVEEDIRAEIAANGGITATLRSAGMDVGLKGTLSRINRGQHVSDEKLLIIARGLELASPPYRAYRPCIKPTSLRTVATGREIADLLEAMNNAQVNMDYVLEALAEKLHDDAASGPVVVMPYSVYGFNEMEGI